MDHRARRRGRPLSAAALGLLVLVRFVDAPGRFYVAALIASVAIDVDRKPLYLGLLVSAGLPHTRIAV